MCVCVFVCLAWDRVVVVGVVVVAVSPPRRRLMDGRPPSLPIDANAMRWVRYDAHIHCGYWYALPCHLAPYNMYDPPGAHCTNLWTGLGWHSRFISFLLIRLVCVLLFCCFFLFEKKNLNSLTRAPVNQSRAHHANAMFAKICKVNNKLMLERTTQCVQHIQMIKLHITFLPSSRSLRHHKAFQTDSTRFANCRHPEIQTNKNKPNQQFRGIFILRYHVQNGPDNYYVEFECVCTVLLASLETQHVYK